MRGDARTCKQYSFNLHGQDNKALESEWITKYLVEHAADPDLLRMQIALEQR